MNTLQYPERVVGPQNSLFLLIRSDLRECNIFLNNLSDILYLRGPGLGGLNLVDHGNLFLWCFLTDYNEIYQLLFTSSKNIDPYQSCRW